MASVTADAAVSELCSNFHTTVQVLPSPEAISTVHLTDATSTAASTSQYYSPRIQWMIENQGRYSNQSDFEIECSKVHRTSVLRPCGRRMEMGTTTLQDMDSGCVSGYGNEGEEGHRSEVEEDERELDEQKLEANRETIREQRRHPLWGAYFREEKDWRYVIGEKIGEGGQAKIYAGVRADKTSVDRGRHVVFKVFPPGYFLRDLVKIWQAPAFQKRPKTSSYRRTAIEHVMLLPNDGRIAIVMRRDWGDLRRLIDIKKQANYNQGPPFDLRTVLNLMYGIAFQMVWLHREGVVHRDLKAANVLLRTQDFHPFEPYHSNLKDIQLSLPQVTEHTVVVSDYECSLGVKGTGLWRAPEVLLNVKDSNEKLFTEKSDVYSYGMLCYEIVTGFLPYEVEGFVEGGTKEQIDLVMNGLRPRFPDDVDWRVRDLITECWHPNEHQRPKFFEIHKAIAKYRLEKNRTRKPYLWYS